MARIPERLIRIEAETGEPGIAIGKVRWPSVRDSRDAQLEILQEIFVPKGNLNLLDRTALLGTRILHSREYAWFQELRREVYAERLLSSEASVPAAVSAIEVPKGEKEGRAGRPKRQLSYDRATYLWRQLVADIERDEGRRRKPSLEDFAEYLSSNGEPIGERTLRNTINLSWKPAGHPWPPSD